MDAKDFVGLQLGVVRHLCDSVVEGVTEDQFNWNPPGKVNSISANLLHLVSGEDLFIHRLLQGKPTLWETGGWAERIGVPAAPRPGQGWEEAEAARIAPSDVIAYRDAVRKETDAYIASLTCEELDRPIDFFGQPMNVGGVLAVLCQHIACHAGDISAVKGMQGTPGLPI